MRQVVVVVGIAALHLSCIEAPDPMVPVGGDVQEADETGHGSGLPDTEGDGLVGDDASSGDTPAEAFPSGPTCYDALYCLMDLKNWTPGKPTTATDCTKNISVYEMGQIDALLSCVDASCVKEFEAWEEGGSTELALLYACMIDFCSEPAAVCIGGHGEVDCGEAIKCLMGCSPLDTDCTIPCLKNTSQNIDHPELDHSVKTGKTLDCVLKECGGMEKLPACDYPTKCVLKCPEFLR